MKKKTYRSFENARKFVRSLKFKNINEYNKWFSENKPIDIPLKPGRIYPIEFQKNGKWGDWLGTGTISSQDKRKQMKSFKDARKFVRNSGLKNTNEWKNYCKSGKKPDDIPSNPNETYTKEWISMPNWLGSKNLSNTRRTYITYDECRKIGQKNKITSQKEWEKFSKSNKRTSKIPGHPRDVYKNSGWISWGHFTGSGRIANQNKNYRSYVNAIKFIHKLKLKNLTEWRKYCKSGKKPEDIPNAPWKVYDEWKVGDWLGNGIVANQNKSKYYLPWPKAKKEYRKLKEEFSIKNYSDWEEFRKNNKKLLEKLHLPASPDRVYTKERVWKREYKKLKNKN